MHPLPAFDPPVGLCGCPPGFFLAVEKVGAAISTEQVKGLHALRTLQLARRCSEETERFFQKEAHDPRFCFELFRRAAKQNDELAWDRLYSCYRSLLIGWIRRHSAYALSGESEDHFANRAFERLWNALSDGGFDRFDDLPSLLRYLQLCVHSVLIDHVRASQFETIGMEAAGGVAASAQAGSPIEQSIVKTQSAAALWKHLDSCLENDQERKLVHATFVLGLKPRQIQERLPKIFAQVSDVYRVKQNVLARLRRDPKMGTFLTHD